MRAKALEWLARYLPLEIAATACALAGGLGVAGLGFNAAIVAYAATWAENIGFYGTALVRELRRKLAGEPLSVTATAPHLLATARSLVSEFGPAELLDSFVLRPGCMYLMPVVTGDLASGLVAGKVLADVAFFGIAIVAYEWGKRHK